jgi:peptidoglycan hydrolase-like protein with peptidoglycan-binding domain
MKKIIKLTEGDLKLIVSKILLEQSSKENIINIQKELIKRGYDVGRMGADGIFGSNTKNAVIKFQKDNGIKQTGFVGDVTSKALGVNSMSKKSNQTTVKTSTKKTQKTNNSDKIQTGISKDSILSPSIDVGFKNKFNIAKLSDKDSTFVCKAGQTECGQFVNDFSKKLSYVGNAWLAHDLDQVGKRVVSAYTSLNPQQVEKVFNIFKQIERQGGPEERKSGGQVENIKKLQQELIKPVSAASLKVDDVVGIYYPGSGHHEEAFHEAGKPYFVSDGKGGWKKGGTIQKGKGFGMNTHVGIVGGMKNGVPLIFHNIGGDVYSDPYNKLRGGGKIAWIKRS